MNVQNISKRKYIQFIILFLLNVNWIIDVANIPEAAKNIIHLLDLILIIWVFKDCRRLRFYKAKWIILWLVMYSIGILIGWIINGCLFVLSLWAFTKTYFLFLFFVCCVMTLNIADVDKILKILCKFQIFNFVLCLFQLVVLNVYGDWLGGIFGIRQGANAYTNIYFIIICTYSMIKYLHKEESIRHLLWIVGSSCILAGLAELTAFFVELSIILIVTTAISKSVTKKIIVFAFCVALLLIGFYVLATYFPTRFNYIYDIQSIITYLGGKENSTYTSDGLYYGGAYSVSRINPFGQINRFFFHNDILKRFWGLGLGNCEMSTNIEIFQSNFYRINGNYEYYIFSHASTYLETGLWGIFSYAFLVLNIIWGWLKYRKIQNKFSGLLEFSFVLSLMSIILFFYNSSVRTPSAYLLFWALSTGPIYVRCLQYNCKDILSPNKRQIN